MFQQLGSACQFVATNAGTGNFVSASAWLNFLTPDVAGAIDGKVYPYLAQSTDGTQWEQGSGVYTAATKTVARTTIAWTSNEDQNLVAFAKAPVVTMFVPSQPSLFGPLRGYIDGLNMQNLLSTLQVNPGVARDSTNYKFITLPNQIGKTTGAWLAGNGNGGLDTGSILASTWYWIFLILNESGNLVDVLFTKAVAAAVAPTPSAMPAGYTLYRYIGSRKTDASSHWITVIQNGDDNTLPASVADVTAGTLTGTPALIALSVPLGVQVWAKFRPNVNAASGVGALFNSPDENAVSTPTTGGPLNASSPPGFGAGELAVRTNTSSQIRGASGASLSYWINTFGWIDRRGRDI